MNESMTLEERIIKVAEEPLGLWAVQRNKRELRAIALEVRKLEDRLKQLEAENDALRADLLLWNEKEVKL
jgi:cell shape-determining protein MreC